MSTPLNRTFRINYPIQLSNTSHRFISTMETETIASRNIVDLLLKEQFDSGICGLRGQGFDKADNGTLTTDDKDFVYGWDC
jgi:prenylcysteine oxidase/farnesylcysteine lyase